MDGGLAILHGNLAPEGCVVKTAGVPEECLTFRGPAKVYESQDDAVEAILNKRIVAGDVVVIRYEGPKGGPGMQEMLYPTSFLKGRGWAGPARCSPTAVSPAAPLGSPSDTPPRRRPPAG